MKALRKAKSGIIYADAPRPKPGPMEVVVEVACAGLCRTDLYVANGQLAVEQGRILGHEFSGEICELGSQIDSGRLAQRVAVFPWIGCGQCHYCQLGEERLQVLCPQRQFLGLDHDGAFAQYIKVPGDRCFPIGGLSYQAAAYAEPVAAALGVKRRDLITAESVAVLGENRIASLTTRLLEHYRDRPLVKEADENSLDAVVESGGDVERAMRLLKPGGTLILKSRPAGTWAWPARLQVEKEITTVGIGYGSFREAIELLHSHLELFQGLWEQPRPLSCWEPVFGQAFSGEESFKSFFVP